MSLYLKRLAACLGALALGVAVVPAISGAGARLSASPLPPSSLGSAGSARPQSDSTQYTLAVTEPGPGQGTVTSSPAGIACPSTCSAAFAAGTQVTLTATPAPGSAFFGWSGVPVSFGCRSLATPRCTFTLSHDMTVTAYFAPTTPILTVALAGTGSVTSSPAGIECPPASEGFCSMWAPPGTQITLTATADAVSYFAGWGGACSGTITCVVTLNSNTTVTANFAAKPRLKVALAGTGSGTVTSSPAGIDCAAACGLRAEPGTQYTLTATPDPGSSFTGWGGACWGTGTCVVTLDSDTVVSAWFASDSPPSPKVCVVPNVKGKTLATAKKTITSHHCSVGKITKIKSLPKNTGHVISQNPKAGEHLKNGAKVALKLGK